VFKNKQSKDHAMMINNPPPPAHTHTQTHTQMHARTYTRPHIHTLTQTDRRGGHHDTLKREEGREEEEVKDADTINMF
jgi:hypothetical protein